MKAAPLILIFLAVSFASSDVRAEAVYLKSGRVMSGRIVEKNDRYIVIQAGEGEAAVKTTIFVEDINRIEGDASGTKALFTPPVVGGGTPADLLQGKASIKTLVTPVAPSLGGGQRIYRPLDARDLQVDELRKLEAAGLMTPEEVYERYQAYFEKLVQEKMSKEAAAQPEPEEKEDAPEAAGTGSISGHVVLPQELKSRMGDLIIYVMREEKPGRFVLPGRLAYVRVRAQEILSFAVPYRIGELPDGRYKIFAQWDIASPSIRQESVAGRVVLGGLGSKGDYTGQYTDAVTLEAGEQKERIDFSCTQLLDKNQYVFQTLPRPDFQVNDVYYRRTPQGDREFFMVVKNRSERLITFLPLDVQINDEAFLPLPMDIQDIKPGEEKEFNITKIIAEYSRKKKSASQEVEEAGPKALKIKILWPATQEIEFEKTLYII